MREGHACGRQGGEKMEIGEKIRQLRLQRGLTQEELANRCELSKGFISQVERDVTSPSIATLIDILECLGTTPQAFFTEEDKQKVVFAQGDMFEKDDEQYGRILWLVPNAQKNEMEPILVELKAGQATQALDPHEGEEFGFVLEGKIRLFIGNKSYELKKGDSFYFKSEKVHFLKNVGAKTAKILWVSSPSNF